MTKTTKKKPLAIVLDIVLWIFLAFIVAFILISVYQKATGKKVIPYTVLWVLTDSMEDTIPAKSYILIKSTNVSDLKVGDIITFHSNDPNLNGSLNTHRIVEIVGDHQEFITQGDNVGIPDTAKVYPNNIVGVYVKNLGLLTFFGRVFTSKLGFTICILLMASCVVFWFMRYIFRTKKSPETFENSEEFNRRVQEEIERLEKENYSPNKENNSHNKESSSPNLDDQKDNS